jgi:RNA polymerase sigma-70 factor (ECF subfamily)
MSSYPTKQQLEAVRDEEFLRLYAEHRARLFVFIGTLLRHWEDAEDVLQLTSVVLRSKFDQFDPSRDFFHWACGIAYRQALRLRGRETRRKQVHRDVAMKKLAEKHIARNDLLESRRAVLNDCVAKLAQRDREIVEHYYYQDRKTVAEVAAELSRPASTVLQALVRIRSSLRVCVDRALARERPR